MGHQSKLIELLSRRTKKGGYHSGEPKPGSPGQLYDLARDPFETYDLWESMPGKVSELEAILLEECR